MNSEKPNWHSNESWRIEKLDWANSEQHFNELVEYVIKTIDGELRDRGKALTAIVPEDELRSEIKIAAENYEEKHHRIGLASHVTLWIRGFVACRLKGQRWR